MKLYYKNVIKILPIIYQRKAEMSEKNRKCMVYFMQVISTIT